jgi:hypothetical protein
MERIQVLIDKLVTQKAAGDSPAQLLITVQYLQQELLKLQDTKGAEPSSKISVWMPANYSIVPGMDVNEYLSREFLKLEVDEEEPLYEAESSVAAQAPGQAEENRSGYVLKKPVVEEAKPQPPKPQPAPKEQVTQLPVFDIAEETPTLIHQPQAKKEIHEVIGKKDASLNDRLKEDKKEVVHVLKDAPVKDLRKAIGLNDKFLFINELFRGDENMYERSIKTINGFQNFAEAEFWIKRELKLKLGWVEKSEAVEHFDQVVRRRFS